MGKGLTGIRGGSILCLHCYHPRVTQIISAKFHSVGHSAAELPSMLDVVSFKHCV